MSGSSNHKRRNDRGVEASISGRRGFELPQKGALGIIVVAQVAADQRGKMERHALNLSPPPVNVAEARKKGKGVDFDISTEQPVQRRMPTHSTAVGQATLPSPSRGLGVVMREYLGRAPVLYEEFLTGGLS
ncbi:hypothetical protein ACOSQ4_013387 [Xanthoceras sorbifolium]